MCFQQRLGGCSRVPGHLAGSCEVTFRALAAQKLFADCDEKLLKRLAEEAWHMSRKFVHLESLPKAFTWTPGRGHEKLACRTVDCLKAEDPITR